MGKQQAVLVRGFPEDGRFQDALLSVEELDVPKPSEGQYLVRVLCRPVNPSDVGRITGRMMKRETPFVPGNEAVGRIEEAGPGASKFAKGTRVVALGWEQGTWQQFTLADEAKLVPVPDSIADQAASQFLINPVTAYGMLEVLFLPPGSWLVQTAAGSVLGRMVIALARARGVRTLNFVRRSEQASELLALGADVVLATDQDGWQACAREVLGEAGAYGAMDAVGGEMTGEVMALTQSGGTTLVYGALAGDAFSCPTLPLLYGERKVQGFMLLAWLRGLGETAARHIAEVWRLFEEGIIQPYTGEALPLSRAAEAVKASERVGRGGKVMLV